MTAVETQQKTGLRHMPKGFGSVYFIQLFSTMSFAVLFATLVLYMKQRLHLSTQTANTITGVYLAYNYGLHLLSGYLGGRFFSYRMLVVIGLIFQLFGSLVLAQNSLTSLYWGLAMMLVGTGTLVTCMNMLLSQLFKPGEVQQRESAFLWNYSSMNIGFILGFSLTGYFQLNGNYHLLFILTGLANLVALLFVFGHWQHLRDRDTTISKLNKLEQLKQLTFGLLIVFALVPTLYWLLHHANISNKFVLLVGALTAAYMLYLAYQHKPYERKKMLVFLILLLSAQIFWVIYQLAPMSLTLFAKHNVNLFLDLKFTVLQIAPGWIQNINGFTIALGAPLLTVLFAWLRHRQHDVSIPKQYASGLILAGGGLLLLPIGIMFASSKGLMAFYWLFITYVCQAVAELLISPIGYSMVGKLIPTRWQSFYMGTLLLNTGVAAILASMFSNYAAGASKSDNPLVTNPSYSHAFLQLGVITLLVALALLLITPWLRNMMGETKKSHAITSTKAEVDGFIINGPSN